MSQYDLSVEVEAHKLDIQGYKDYRKLFEIKDIEPTPTYLLTIPLDAHGKEYIRIKITKHKVTQ